MLQRNLILALAVAACTTDSGTATSGGGPDAPDTPSLSTDTDPVPLPDSGPPPDDTGDEPDLPPEEGAFGWPCSDNGDCDAGLCIHTADGKICTEFCVESCAQGFSCELVQTAGADPWYACLPRFVSLCSPCRQIADCNPGFAVPGAQCLSYGEEGSFCGAVCLGASDCPDGYGCVDGQCALESGVCACSDVALGAETDCTRSNEVGTCDGTRSCTSAGLSECDAPQPAAELCDQLDNDCDGVADEDCDGDGVAQDEDNCPLVANEDQLDGDGDGQGDECDADDDGDNVPDTDDCAPTDGAVYPGANEVCDQKDNDCDESVDEGLCDDANSCTDDICGADGGCLNPENAQDCDDGSVCTQVDSCIAGVCVGSDAIDCSDGDECSVDSCDAVQGCVSTALESGPCEDGDVCTLSDACDDGVCKPGAANPCDDGDQCTADSCDGGCQHAATNPCEDGNPCTDDACQPTACVNSPNAAVCDDGSVCTQVDLCSAGVCTGGSNILCDDGVPCTDNLCDSQTGCHYPVSTGTPCEDGNSCTGPDLCQQGSCATGPAIDCDDADPCTVDQCNPFSGCTHQATNPCTDGNDCTDDVCEPLVGCKFPPNSDPCADGSVCSTGDQCQSGACAGTGTLNCDDGTDCTVDQCNPTTGCFWTPNDAGTCTDGNACTSIDACSGGVCLGSGSPVCSDGEPCTDDLCDPIGGCVFPPNTAGCNDGDPCTVSDTCGGGKCNPGTPHCELQGCIIGFCLPLGDIPLCTCLD